MHCRVEGCKDKVNSRGLCSIHYGRFLRHGSTENKQGQKPKKDPIARFFSKIEVQENGCWHWTAGLNKYGYGKFKVEGKTVGAHRFSWFIHNGELPREIVLDHLCHTRDEKCLGGICQHRKCVNPEHLDPCSNAENTKRSLPKRNPSNLCRKKLHKMSDNNLKLWKSKQGVVKRRCLKCQTDYQTQKKT